VNAQTIDIGGRRVGRGQPCFVIAEAGVNHNGSLEMARQLVDAAVNANADAVKFQTFNAERILTLDAPKADYQIQATGNTESQLEMIRRLELSKEAHQELMRYCQDKGILFMSSPFDEMSADLLDEIDVAVFKVPSGEITNLPFLGHIARKQKPMLISTGMSYLSEVEMAVRTVEEEQNRDYVLLQCTSNYPANPADANLSAMESMAAAFGALVGYSDHTQGIEVPLAAVALGACVIEKHLTTDRTLPGPDHLASLEPEEFTVMVRAIRIVESALGHGRKEPAASEANTASVARKSLVSSMNIPAGTVLTKEFIAIKRPGTGLPPAMLPHLIGRTARAAISEGELITLDLLT
jgi:N-acetylneuraminate synthase